MLTSCQGYKNNTVTRYGINVWPLSRWIVNDFQNLFNIQTKIKLVIFPLLHSKQAASKKSSESSFCLFTVLLPETKSWGKNHHWTAISDYFIELCFCCFFPHIFISLVNIETIERQFKYLQIEHESFIFQLVGKKLFFYPIVRNFFCVLKSRHMEHIDSCHKSERSIKLEKLFINVFMLFCYCFDNTVGIEFFGIMLLLLWTCHSKNDNKLQ
jgi:hypothetical protein